MFFSTRILLIAVMVFSVSCSVDLRQIPVTSDSSAGPNLCEMPVLIGDVQVVSFDSRHDSIAWKSYLLSVLKSRRLFKDTMNLERAGTLKGPFMVLDLVFRPTYTNDYDWWWTWPAVYPLVGYWPVQIREGTYTASIEYRLLDRSQRLLAEDRVELREKESVGIYGFYRTKPVERMVYRTNQELALKWVQSVETSIRNLDLCRQEQEEN
ncbi:MAG TPA: hypothetical protein DEA96_14065 [Leptospiraceae bacterium]|nr:hypothetical protein [Spirochaetaceae bacterium]HBS06088.1 hypothetical protein [Leptospiraceae bacterium]